MSPSALVFSALAWLVFGLSPSDGVDLYGAALRHGVEPADLVAMWAAESSDHSSVGDHGERGGLQLSDLWRRAYNRETGSTFRPVDLHEPSVNFEVGAWAVSEMQRKHRGCRPRGGHGWTAHYQCATAVRGTAGCDTSYRDWLVARARRLLGGN